MGADDAALSDGGRGRVDEAGAADAVASPSVSGGGGAGVSSGEALVGGAVGDPPGGGLGRGTASGPAGLDDGPAGDQPADDPVGDPVDGSAKTGGTGPADRKGQRSTPAGPGGGPSAGDQSADGASAGDRLSDGPIDDLPTDGLADNLPAGDPASGLPDDGHVDDLPDDGGGGMSPVVREYVERLRSEALARDAQLRARGIDPYKGTPVDEEPRRRWRARAMAALVVLVAVVSVGAYVVFFHGEPDYGMSHGYQVQSDGSLKRPSTPVHQPSAPAELLRFTDDASEIAATHYFEAVAYAWNTGDTQYLRAFSSPDCQFCQKTADEIERLYTEGGWASGSAYSNMTTEMLGKSENTATFGDQSYGVRVRYHECTPDLYHDHSFQPSRESDNSLIVIVHWDGQRWLIRDIGKEEE